MVNGVLDDGQRRHGLGSGGDGGVCGVVHVLDDGGSGGCTDRDNGGAGAPVSGVGGVSGMGGMGGVFYVRCVVSGGHGGGSLSETGSLIRIVVEYESSF